MSKDIIDRLTEYDAPEAARDYSERTAGIRKCRCMVVPARASCAEEIEEQEAAYLAEPHFPIPFWSGDGDGLGMLEPLTADDFKLLAAAGVTAEQWEIAVLEDQLERNEP